MFNTLNFNIMKAIYVVSAKQIMNIEGKFVGNTSPWLTISAFRSKKHAEAEIEKLKSWEYEQESYAYDIDEIMLY